MQKASYDFSPVAPAPNIACCSSVFLLLYKAGIPKLLFSITIITISTTITIIISIITIVAILAHISIIAIIMLYSCPATNTNDRMREAVYKGTL